MNVSLTAELETVVNQKVQSGMYNSAIEVIREGLRALRGQDGALEQWLRTEGVARYDAYHRNAESGRPAAEVFARLRARAGKKQGTAKKR